MQKGHRDQTRLFAGVLTSLRALSMLWRASLGNRLPRTWVCKSVCPAHTPTCHSGEELGRGQKTKKSQMLSAFPGETKHYLKGL